MEHKTHIVGVTPQNFETNIVQQQDPHTSKTYSSSGSQTRGPQGRFVRPAMPFGNFQIIIIYIIEFIHRCLRVLGYRVNKFLLKERRDG